MSTVRLSLHDFEDVVTAEGIVVVNFQATQYDACRSFAPVFEAASRRHPDLVFATVDAETDGELSAGLGVRSVPTLMVFRDGVLVFAEPGALPGDSMDLLLSTIRALDMAAVRMLLRDQ